MIVVCNNCQKKFNINSNLIPEKGRLLQCNSCNHKWFFIKDIVTDPVELTTIENEETIKFFENNSKFNETITNNENEDTEKFVEEKKLKLKNFLLKPKKKRNLKILNYIVIFLISVAAFIVILDTFKSPFGKIVPNIEILLYNLYETFKDINLFIRDLL